MQSRYILVSAAELVARFITEVSFLPVELEVGFSMTKMHIVDTSLPVPVDEDGGVSRIEQGQRVEDTM